MSHDHPAGSDVSKGQADISTWVQLFNIWHLRKSFLAQEHFRNVVVSSYHYFGSASFGKVVDGEDLLVKGTENLHVPWRRRAAGFSTALCSFPEVIDASIFPNPTRTSLSFLDWEWYEWLKSQPFQVSDFRMAETGLATVWSMLGFPLLGFRPLPFLVESPRIADWIVHSVNVSGAFLHFLLVDPFFLVFTLW